MNDELLRSILWQQSDSRATDKMTSHIRNLAYRLGADDLHEEHGNLYVVKGKPASGFYPTYVAHTDTVHDIIAKYTLMWDEKRRVYYAWNDATDIQHGVGGDDKVGIYLALYMLEKLPAVKLAFFRDEEIGCVGSSLADLDFFEDSAFVLQGDRRGYGDFVNEAGAVELHGEAFATTVAPLLTRYGMKPSWGLMTDVEELKSRGLKVACANVACGYYLPHTKYEYIKVREVERVQGFFRRMAERHGDVQHTHEPKRRYAYYGKGTGKDHLALLYTNYRALPGGTLVTDGATTTDDDAVDGAWAEWSARDDALLDDYFERRDAAKAWELAGYLAANTFPTLDWDSRRYNPEIPVRERFDDEDDPIVFDAYRAWLNGENLDGDCPWCGHNTLIFDPGRHSFWCLVCEETTKYVWHDEYGSLKVMEHTSDGWRTDVEKGVGRYARVG